MYRKNIYGVSTIHGFRYPLGGLEIYPLKGLERMSATLPLPKLGIHHDLNKKQLCLLPYF